MKLVSTQRKRAGPIRNCVRLVDYLKCTQPVFQFCGCGKIRPIKICITLMSEKIHRVVFIVMCRGQRTATTKSSPWLLYRYNNRLLLASAQFVTMLCFWILFCHTINRRKALLSDTSTSIILMHTKQPSMLEHFSDFLNIFAFYNFARNKTP